MIHLLISILVTLLLTLSCNKVSSYHSAIIGFDRDASRHSLTSVWLITENHGVFPAISVETA